MPEIPASDYVLSLDEGSIRAYEKDSGATSSNMMMVSPDALNILPGFNVRIIDTPQYAAKVKGLAESIANEGYYRDKPFTGFIGKGENGENKLFVFDGHGRYAAIEYLREHDPEHVPERVPVLLKAKGTSMLDATVALAKTGEGLQPLEMAILAKRIVGMGLEPPEVARRIGITPNYCNKLLLLASASKKIIGQVALGKVSATLAIEQLEAKGNKGAEKKLADAVAAAAAKGRKKATKKDLVEDPEETVSTAVSKGIVKIVFKAAAGASVPFDTIKSFATLNDGSWFEYGDDQTTVTMTQDVAIKITGKFTPRAAEDTTEETPAEDGAENDGDTDDI